MLQKIKSLNDNWFYSNPNPLLRLFLIYIKGDMIVLLPFCLGILVLGLIAYKVAFLIAVAYFTFRALGEMIYWLLQQFGEQKYRPNDFGFKNLSNNSIYIIYQTLALVQLTIGFVGLFFINTLL